MSDQASENVFPRAVALRYDEDGGAAPRVVASGVGEVAQRILDTAAESGVPIQSDTDLVELLSTCELHAEIPVELYDAVAQLLAWLYGLNGDLRAD